MKKEIQIKKFDIDWLVLIKLAFKRKDWGKSFTIFEYGDVHIDVKMTSFNFEENIAHFQLNALYPQREELTYNFYSQESVEYVLDNYSPEFFNQLMLKKIKRLIKGITLKIAEKRGQKKYEKLHFSYYDINDRTLMKQGHKDVLNQIRALDDDDIRESAEDKLKTKVHEKLNEDFNSKVEEFVENYKYVSLNMNNLLKEIVALIKKSEEESTKE